MKKGLIKTAKVLGILLVVLYGLFLFCLPFLNLDGFKPDIQKIAKEQANLDVNFEKLRIITTPTLQAGARIEGLSVKLPDGSELFTSQMVKARISLPALFTLTVKVPCFEVVTPVVNLDIANGEQFKLVRLIEDILNKQKNMPPQEESSFSINPAWIKIKVPNVVLKDYEVAINDLKSGHYLALSGEKLSAGYNNGKTVKVKTVAKLMSDDKTNIVANVNINTFLPPPVPVDPEDDPAEKIELPFMNPVLMYRDYDLKSNINTKLKIRQKKDGLITARGYLDVDGITMNLAGYQLPDCYFHAKFHGVKADIDTNLYVAKDQNINVLGRVKYDKKPAIDLSILSGKIYFNDMIILAKAFLDTLHINNDFESLKGQGYWEANARIKTNFKKLKSNGYIVAKDGSIANGLTKLVFDKINANFCFDNDMLNIKDTSMLINGNLLKAEGSIAPDSYTDIKVYSENLPLPGLFLAFAPSDLKKAFVLEKGALSVDANIQGKLQKSLVSAKVLIKDFVFKDKKNAFVLKDDNLAAGVVTDMKTLHGEVVNRNFKVFLPATSSTILVPALSLKMDEKDIILEPSDILINSNSKIGLSGTVTSYATEPQIIFDANGLLHSVDLRQFAGRDAAPFIAAKGNLPLIAQVRGDAKKQAIVMQVLSDAKNYLTPVDVLAMNGKQSILQAKIDYKGDRLHIRKTGFYTGVKTFTDNLDENLLDTQTVAEISGTIVDLKTPQPFINMLSIQLPQELNARLAAFQKSSLKANGHLVVFGKLASPLMRGRFAINNLSIPELLTSMDETAVKMFGKNIDLAVNNLLLNGSDVNVDLKTDIIPRTDFTISKLDVNSNSINLDKMMKVTELLTHYMAPPQKGVPVAQQPADIPVAITSGNIDLKRIKTGGIVAHNTTGNISLKNNNFYLRHLRTNAFDGRVTGNVVANIITMAMKIKVDGSGIDANKALIGVANMKDTLSGTVSFKTDIGMQGVTYEEQMKSLDGTVDFAVIDGQLGPFGKLENMILAENIRESQFFQTALGGVINSLTTIDTTHFSLIDGHIMLKDGIAYIDPITTAGDVMCLNITGSMDLLANTIDMKVRGKLASFISNMLGPIAQLNPINLVKITPGLNVIMAQAFALFCEQVTEQELAAIPALGDSVENLATKFQIVLRGDVAKPLSLLKSFKWLALSSEMEQAQGFVSTLPDPSIMGDVSSATVEEIMQAQELKAIEDAKLKNRLIRFFKGEEQ